MHLDVLFEPKIDLPRLAQVLDELGHLGRVDTVRRWGRKKQAALYEAAQGFRPVTLDDFVPKGIDPLVEVIHHGKNTLPAFTHFQKRFCKPADASLTGKLWGYNHQDLAWATGPGFFVTHASTTDGEIDVDYRELPTEKPASWPAIVPNTDRLGRFVYAGMVDVMRGVSSHVTIGRARRHAKGRGDRGDWMDAWFVLVREDRPES